MRAFFTQTAFDSPGVFDPSMRAFESSLTSAKTHILQPNLVFMHFKKHSGIRGAFKHNLGHIFSHVL